MVPPACSPAGQGWEVTLGLPAVSRTLQGHGDLSSCPPGSSLAPISLTLCQGAHPQKGQSSLVQCGKGAPELHVGITDLWTWHMPAPALALHDSLWPGPDRDCRAHVSSVLSTRPPPPQGRDHCPPGASHMAGAAPLGIFRQGGEGAGREGQWAPALSPERHLENVALLRRLRGWGDLKVQTYTHTPSYVSLNLQWAWSPRWAMVVGRSYSYYVAARATGWQAQGHTQ